MLLAAGTLGYGRRKPAVRPAGSHCSKPSGWKVLQ
ncbi:MprA protease, GlyGly-CTERM protein-sorting domain-containing form [Arthrobacter globiformis]